MELFMRCLVGLRSCGMILDDFSHTLTACNVWHVDANIRIRETVQQLVQLGGQVVILEFPEMCYLSSN